MVALIWSRSQTSMTHKRWSHAGNVATSVRPTSSCGPLILIKNRQITANQHLEGLGVNRISIDKANSIRGNPLLSDLLQTIIEEVIGGRRARAFLFSSYQRDSRIEQLFDSRLLHVLKKNVSSHDQPGVRYDVYKIDYGCYVELMNTASMPQGLFQLEDEDDNYVEVPRDDYRSIRRAILVLDPL